MQPGHVSRKQEPQFQRDSIDESCGVCSERCWELFCKVPDRLRGITDQIWEVQRCQNCGLGVTFPLPREEDLLGIYPSEYWGDVRRTVDEYCSGELLRTRSWRKETEKYGSSNSLYRGAGSWM